jgi:phage shock protein PspC (stress-responsive transcriptional regulator)
MRLTAAQRHFANRFGRRPVLIYVLLVVALVFVALIAYGLAAGLPHVSRKRR